MGADVGGEGGCSALLVGIPMTLAGLYLIMVNLGNAFFPHHERDQTPGLLFKLFVPDAEC
jgi:hypothetical protein